MGKVDPDELLKMFNAGEPSSAIRKRFGISTTNLTYWKRKLGLPATQWRKCNPDAVRRLASDGKTDREIAEALGVGADRVGVIRRRMGVDHNNGRASAEYRAARSEQLKRRIATGQVHAARRRAFAIARSALARRYNLPEDLLPVQVQIVVALAAGPMQVNELADRLNRGPARNGYARFFYPKAPGGNLLVGLRAKGLIFSTRTRYGALYCLTPRCMDLLSGAKDDTRRDDRGSGTAGETGREEAESPRGR